MFRRAVVEKNQNIYCIFNFFFENHAFYEVMGKNIVEPDRSQVTVWCRLNACWVPKAINTHSEYVIYIAVPRQ